MAEDAAFDMAAARAKFASKVSGNKTARKARGKKLAAAVDKRSLRDAGRDVVFSFRCRDDLQAACKAAAKAKGQSIAEWMEAILQGAIDMEASEDA